MVDENMPVRIDVSKSVKLVRALLVLRSIHPDQVAYQSGISLENLKAWLNGASTALGPHSYVELFKFLGVSKGGLLPDRVHLWTIDARWTGRLDQKQMWVLEWAGNLVNGCKMMEIVDATDKRKIYYKKKRIFLIQGNNIRVVLHVLGQWIEPPAVTPEMMPGVQWNGDDGKAVIMRAEGHFLSGAEQGSLTPVEFDDLFSGEFARCSWENLRLMAREYAVTPVQIMNWIMTQRRPVLTYKSVPGSENLPLLRVEEDEMSEFPDILRMRDEPVIEDVSKADEPSEEAVVSEQQPPRPGQANHRSRRKKGQQRLHPADQMSR